MMDKIIQERKEREIKANQSVTMKVPRLKVLWIVSLDYRSGLNHGSNLRFINLSREFTNKGHESYFLVRNNKLDDVAEKRQYLDNLKNCGIIKDYFEVEYNHPNMRGKLAHLTVHPYLSNRILQKAQQPAISEINRVVSDKKIELCVFADRVLLFALPTITKSTKTIIDWVDSAVLYRMRELKLSLKDRQFTAAPSIFKSLADVFIEEKFYGKQADINITVSPIDKKYFDSVNKAPQKNKVLLNGIKILNAAVTVNKIKNRIIFSGNMNFPPNYESAIWFIDKVMPLLRKRTNGDIKLVIAGASPVEKLLSKAGQDIEITGFVEDMSKEIAVSALYVAPLVCGGGFKNKVIEAIMSGTFIVATSMAVEFLEEEVRTKLLISDDPKQLAEYVLTVLNEPDMFAKRLSELQRIIERDFTWSNRTEEFIQITREILC